MFKSNFKYQQFSESIIKKVKDLGELFELLQNRSNFVVFKWQASRPSPSTGESGQEKMALKLRREFF